MCDSLDLLRDNTTDFASCSIHFFSLRKNCSRNGSASLGHSLRTDEEDNFFLVAALLRSLVDRSGDDGLW